jgi:hypothetical protein
VKDVKDTMRSMEQAHAAILATIAAKPGDICCYKIFTNPELAPTRANKLSSVPQFKEREHIVREMTAGLEKSMKRS